MVLVDTEGEIIHYGNPAKFDLERDIETLVKGEEIGASAQDEKDSLTESLHISKVNEELAQFEEKGKEFFGSNEIIKKYATINDIVVAERKSTFNIDTQKF